MVSVANMLRQELALWLFLNNDRLVCEVVAQFFIDRYFYARARN